MHVWVAWFGPGKAQGQTGAQARVKGQRVLVHRLLSFRLRPDVRTSAQVPMADRPATRAHRFLYSWVLDVKPRPQVFEEVGTPDDVPYWHLQMS